MMRPIVVSAPHGGDKLLPDVPVREDRGQKSFTTIRDQNTAQLAERLASQLEKLLGGPPYLVIAHFDRQNIDVNRAPTDAYTPPGDNGAKELYHAYHTALANATASSPIALRVFSSRNGDGASSITFWWRRWIEHSRSLR